MARRPPTVARLLRRAFTVLIALILLAGAAGVAGAALQYRSVRELTGHVLPMRLANVQAHAVLADAQREIRGYQLTGDRDFLTGYQAAQRDFSAICATLRAMAEREESSGVEEQIRRAGAWWDLADRQLGAPGGTAATEPVARGRALFERFQASNSAMDARLADRAATLRAEAGLLRTGSYVAAGLVIAAAAASAAARAVKATRQITGPLDAVVDVLARLSAGDHAARVPADRGPQEMRALAAAINERADEAERFRAEERAERDLGRAARRLGVLIRGHLSVDAALAEAVEGMGRLFRADHTAVRLRGAPGGPAGSATWSAPGAPGSPSALSGGQLDWLAESALSEGPMLLDRPEVAPLPPAEIEALAAAGAGPVAILPVTTGDALIGCLVLVKRAGRHPWRPRRVLIAEQVAGDLGRGVEQAGLYERERRLVAELKDLDRIKSDLLSTVTHELRTPLTSIAGYTEMLRDEDAGPLTPGQAGMLDAINRNARRLRQLIEDLLTLARVEDGTFHSARDPVELAALVADARRDVEPAAAAAGLVLAADVAGPLDVAGDPDQLRQLLANLLSNAVKFTPAGGRVTVSARRQEDEIVVVVTDTGIGIPAHERSRVFGRFFRASNALREEIQGTGLGLAISHAIVHGHGGELSLSTAEGKGTTVTVRLPAAGVMVAADGSDLGFGAR